MTAPNYVFGAGLSYRPEEFQAMGVEKHERVGRMTEGLELIKRLWTEDSVTHHGRYFQLDDARASIRPKQSPGRQSGSVATSSQRYGERRGSPMPGAWPRPCRPSPC